MKTNKEVNTEIANIKAQITNIQTALTADNLASEALKAVNVVNETIQAGIKAKLAQIASLENLIVSLESDEAKNEAAILMQTSLLNSQLADQTISVNFTLKTVEVLNDKGEATTDKNGDKIYEQICLVSFGKVKTVTLTDAGKRNLEAGTQAKNAEGLKIWKDATGKEYFAKSGADLCKELGIDPKAGSANKALADQLGIEKVMVPTVNENDVNVKKLTE